MLKGLAEILYVEVRLNYIISCKKYNFTLIRKEHILRNRNIHVGLTGTRLRSLRICLFVFLNPQPKDQGCIKGEF